MRRALVIGINDYDHCGNLGGCVRDATRIAEMLEANGDGHRTLMFDCLRVTRTRYLALSSTTPSMLYFRLPPTSRFSTSRGTEPLLTAMVTSSRGMANQVAGVSV
jgi:hypothetical protein